MLLQCNRLNKGKPASYDEGAFVVRTQKLGVLKCATAIVVIVLLFGLIANFKRYLTQQSAGFKDPVTGMEFVFVKGGCFQMGDNFGEIIRDDEPVHEVCVNDYYIGKYEVTQGEWQTVMGSNPSYLSRMVLA